MNRRFFVGKKPGFQIEEKMFKEEVKNKLNIEISQPRIYQLYDVFELDEESAKVLKNQVISENNIDEVYEQLTISHDFLAYEPIAGAYDQRADSCEQCLRFILPHAKAKVKTGKLIVFQERLETSMYQKIKDYFVNPLEFQIKDLECLAYEMDVTIEEVKSVESFIEYSVEECEALMAHEQLAMRLEDLLFIQTYFRKEGRNPSLAEVKVLDTYWSDHCRHTTFESELTALTIEEGTLKQRLDQALSYYVECRALTHREHHKMSFMDMASIVARVFKKQGKVTHMEESEEVNACSIEVEIEVDGKNETWLVMYKNETHNHPTEIEPYGGAATCIGGAIRDPLSGRAYVYQAMRISGAADITQPIEVTLANKLPQVQISKGAAAGYSSYGNQIGLATTYVKELYDEGYLAKRMEVGAVVGAVKKDHVRRETCLPGDLVILLGGATGRDGIGGATGSSIAHNPSSLHTCAAQVQKGNALIERKIQRLFRNPELTRCIKKANDFGAGGVCVAVGELADGLRIDLDAVDTKYAGLNGLEIAISESQERMAIVIDPKDFAKVQALCESENLEARRIAEVTDEHRLMMTYKGQVIVDLDRDFINTSGVTPKQEVVIESTLRADPFHWQPLPHGTLEAQGYAALQTLNTTNQQGLVEFFDASVGRSSVLAPFGGRYRRSESLCSIQKLPTLQTTSATSALSYGYIPRIAKAHPYLGASYGVLEALARQVACGQSLANTTLSCQEYFPSLKDDPIRFGQVGAAMFGLLDAQRGFGICAIGGKDSMSGTYQALEVPPMLMSFALSVNHVQDVIVNHLTAPHSYLYLVKHTPLQDFTIDYAACLRHFKQIQEWNQKGMIRSASTIQQGGLFVALAKMAFGNMQGCSITYDRLFDLEIGSFIIESDVELDGEDVIYLGKTIVSEEMVVNGVSFPLEKLWNAHSELFKDIYPLTQPVDNHQEWEGLLEQKPQKKRKQRAPQRIAKPNVVIPIFPGTNSEYDSKKAFEAAGASVEFVVINNNSPKQIEESMEQLAKQIETSQILFLAGGFSGGDEPDGSGKFMVSILHHPKVARAIEHLQAQQGLILGICNGFQALIKSGLLPYGTLMPLREDAPTLFRNDTNTHEAKFGYTKIVPNHCVFTQNMEAHEVHLMAFSHGEGKFVATREQIEQFYRDGQIVSLYCNHEGELCEGNFNGAMMGVEGLCSKDGRIFGKMGHSERYEAGCYQNLEGNPYQPIFENAVTYFTWKEGTK